MLLSIRRNQAGKSTDFRMNEATRPGVCDASKVSIALDQNDAEQPLETRAMRAEVHDRQEIIGTRTPGASRSSITLAILAFLAVPVVFIVLVVILTDLVIALLAIGSASTAHLSLVANESRRSSASRWRTPPSTQSMQ